MSTPSSDGTPTEAPSLAQSNTDEDLRPRFHQRDAAAIAEEAALGEHGPLQVAGMQDFYRQIFVGAALGGDKPCARLGDLHCQPRDFSL
jgi:hypothetical protein